MVSGAVRRVQLMTLIGLAIVILGALIPQSGLFDPKTIVVMGVAYSVLTAVRDYLDPKVPNK